MRVCITIFPVAVTLLFATAVAAADAASDTLLVPVERDTVQAGDWTITGDIARPDSAAAAGISEQERSDLKNTLRRVGSPEVPGLRSWQRKKVPKVALFSSALMPGLGQLYVGRRIKVGLAVGFFATYTGWGWLHWKDAQSWTAYRDKLPAEASTRVADQQIEYHKESARDRIWWAGAVWVISMLDAWIDAHLYDLRVYTPPPAPETSAGVTPAESDRYITLTIEF